MRVPRDEMSIVGNAPRWTSRWSYSSASSTTQWRAVRSPSIRSRAKLLRKPNVRTTVIDEEIFRRLSDVCDPALRPILTVAFDTGMRKREILDLRWEQVELKLGIIRLAPQDTKGKEHRPVYM